MAQASTDWVVFVDPDQRLPLGVEAEARRVIANDPSVGLIGVPMRNHFLGKPVRYGRWGGPPLLHPAFMHRDRVNITPYVHRGLSVKSGFSAQTVGHEPDCAIVHYWADSWGQFIAKQKRYFDQEAVAAYDAGQRFAWPEALGAAAGEVVRSLVWQLGILDGPRGILLSFAWGWYVWGSRLALRKHQRSLG